MLGKQVKNYIHKPDKLLARQLKGMQADRAINKISAVTDPRLINVRFLEFFSRLYISKAKPRDSGTDDFFYFIL